MNNAADPTPSETPLFSPTRPDERISSLDVLRGVAVLGILLLNIVAFGLPIASYADPTIAGGAEGINLYAWIANEVFFEGTQRTIFSLLFGAGIILFTARAEARGNASGVADLYYRRNLWLIVFGVIHAYLLLWIGEILYGYGVTALFLFVFRKLGPKTLLVIGLVVLAVLIPKRVLHLREIEEAQQKYAEARAAEADGKTLDAEQRDALCDWRAIEKVFKPTPFDVQREIESHRGGYLTNLQTLAPINRSVQGKWFYRWNFWDISAAMLLGMALLKLKVLTAGRSYGFYAAMVVIGYTVGITTNALEVKALLASHFDLIVMQRTHLTYDLGRLAVAAGHVGVVMLICKAGCCGLLTQTLAAVGRMALTNYIMQTLICVTVFSGFGFGLYGRLERHQLYCVVAAIWVAQLIISPVWLRFFQFGPLEWAWRSLTYWRIQRILQSGPAEPVTQG